MYINEIRIMVLELAYVVLGTVLCFRCGSHVQSIAITAISTRINAAIYMCQTPNVRQAYTKCGTQILIFEAKFFKHSAYYIVHLIFGTSLGH